EGLRERADRRRGKPREAQGSVLSLPTFCEGRHSPAVRGFDGCDPGANGIATCALAGATGQRGDLVLVEREWVCSGRSESRERGNLDEFFLRECEPASQPGIDLRFVTKRD